MKFYLLTLALLTQSQTAFSFPDLIRHGYVNCTACHTSPSGGGLMTDYGRNLSADLVSTWGDAKEAEFLNGLLPAEKIKDWFLIGGNYRGLQYHYENDKTKDGDWYNMQALLEAAVLLKNWTLQVAAGKLTTENAWQPKVNRWFVMNQITEQISVRVGKFLPQFGLNIPEHVSPTRSALGFGTNSEQNTAELQWSNENQTFVTSVSRSDSSHAFPNENAILLKYEKVFGDTLKPGFSIWSSESSQSKRSIIGLHGLLGLTTNQFILSEIDYQESILKGSNTKTNSVSTYNKYGYEFFKGLIGFVVLDAKLSKAEDPQTRVIHYGPGLQFFPRPHLKFETVWTREQAPQISTKEGDYAWFVFHYYL